MTQACPGETPDSGSSKSTSSPSANSRAGAGGRVERTRAATSRPCSGRSSSRAGADPVEIAQFDARRGERLARPDDHARLGRVERDDIERFGRGDAEAAALADRVMEDAVVAAKHAPVDMHDVAGLGGAGSRRSIMSL